MADYNNPSTLTDRQKAIGTVIAMGMAIANDHPRDLDVWLKATLSSLAGLGVTDAEMAEACKGLDFIHKDDADLAHLNELIKAGK